MIKCKRSILLVFSAEPKTLHVEHFRRVMEDVDRSIERIVKGVDRIMSLLVAGSVQDGDEKTFECSCDAHAISNSARYAPVNPITGAHFTRRLDIHTVSYRTKLEQPIAYVIDFS